VDIARIHALGLKMALQYCGFKFNMAINKQFTLKQVLYKGKIIKRRYGISHNSSYARTVPDKSSEFDLCVCVCECACGDM
jgi:hypothetical protein